MNTNPHGQLEISDLCSARPTKPADEVASAVVWHELREKLQCLLFSHDIADSLLVKEVIELYWKWFQRAAPQQAAELTDGVLRAVTAVFDSMIFVASRTGHGITIDEDLSTVPEVWRLFRLTQLFLAEIGEHFRFIPDALLDSIVITTLKLFGRCSQASLTAVDSDGLTNTASFSSPPPPPSLGDDALAELDPAHFFALLDPSNQWFRKWCCRLHAMQFGHYVVASGVLEKFVERSQRKGRCGRRKCASSTSASSSIVSTMKRYICLDHRKAEIPSATASDPKVNAQELDRSFVSVADIEEMLLQSSVSAIGSIVLFHNGVIIHGGRFPDDAVRDAELSNTVANGYFRKISSEPSSSEIALDLTALIQELAHNFLRGFFATSAQNGILLQTEDISADALAKLAEICPGAVDSIVTETLGPILSHLITDADSTAERLQSLLPKLGRILAKAYSTHGRSTVARATESSKSLFHSFLQRVVTLKVQGKYFQVSDFTSLVTACIGFIEAAYNPVLEDIDLLKALGQIISPNGSEALRDAICNWGLTTAGVGALERSGLLSVCCTHLANKFRHEIEVNNTLSSKLLLICKNIWISREGYIAFCSSALVDFLLIWFQSLQENINAEIALFSEDLDKFSLLFDILSSFLYLCSSEFCMEIPRWREFFDEIASNAPGIIGTASVSEYLTLKILLSMLDSHYERIKDLGEIKKALQTATSCPEDALQSMRHKLSQALHV